MLTRFIKTQLDRLRVLTVVALLVLGWYYLRLPTLAGIGQYTLTADLPSSGGLYRTSNVTYRGITIGKVTDVEPTENGVRATMSISDKYKIPVDAVGQCALGVGGRRAVPRPGVRRQSRSVLRQRADHHQGDGARGDRPGPGCGQQGLAALPADKIPVLLNETAQAVGGLGPSLQRLVDGTQAIVTDFKTNIHDVNDIIQNSAADHRQPGRFLECDLAWSANLNTIASQTAATGSGAARMDCSRPRRPPTAVNAVFSDVREALPQTLANLEIVLDMLKRYNKGVEQSLVLLPQGASVAQTVSSPYPHQAALDFGLTINQPPPCLTGFLPASQWRAPADTSLMPVPNGPVLQDSARTPRPTWCAARATIPCADVPGQAGGDADGVPQQRAVHAAGHQPVVRRSRTRSLNCPAPGARCDQPVNPGYRDTGTDDQQRDEPVAGRSAARDPATDQ